MFALLKKIFDNAVNLLHHIKCNLSCCSSVVNVRVVEHERAKPPSTSSRKQNPLAKKSLLLLKRSSGGQFPPLSCRSWLYLPVLEVD